MSRVFTVLFVTTILALGVSRASSVKQDLETKLSKTNAALEETVQDVKRLNREIKEEIKQCALRLKASRDIKNKGNAEHHKLVKTIEDLYKKLLKSYDAEDTLLDISKSNKKLELSIIITLENIEKYKERRKKGLNNQCFDLEKMTTKKPVNHSNFMFLRRIDDTVVLENRLKLARSKLEQETRLKNEKKFQLKKEKEWCKKQQKNLDDTIKSLTKTKVEATKAVDELKEKLAKQEKIVKELKSKNATNIKELEKTKKRAKKVLKKYNKFESDKECYSKLYEDFVSLINNHI